MVNVALAASKEIREIKESITRLAEDLSTD